MTTNKGRGLMAPDLEGASWRKSSYSGSASQCVEIADLTTTSHSGIAVRDSKNPSGPALMFDQASFANFLAVLRVNL